MSKRRYETIPMSITAIGIITAFTISTAQSQEDAQKESTETQSSDSDKPKEKPKQAEVVDKDSVKVPSESPSSSEKEPSSDPKESKTQESVSPTDPKGSKTQENVSPTKRPQSTSEIQPQTEATALSSEVLQSQPQSQPEKEPSSTQVVVISEPVPPLPLIPSGSFFTRYELREGQREITVPSPRVGEMDAIAFRARFGLATSPMNVTDCLKTQVQFTPQAAGFWEAGGTVDAPLELHEGYVRFLSCNFKVELGRMEMAYGDHLMIGNVDWNQTGRSFDGLRLRLGTDPKTIWIDLIFTSIVEGLYDFIPIIGAGDKYLMGLYTGFGSLVAKKTDLDFYALVHYLPKIRIPAENLEEGEVSIGETSADLTLGSRFKTRVNLVDIRLEAGVQVGSRRKESFLGGSALHSTAYQVDGEVGINLFRDDLRVAGGGLYASGDDPETEDEIEGWDQLYPTAHKWLGLSDIIGGRSNIAGPLFRISYCSPWKVLFSVDGHMFFRPQEQLIVADDGSASEIDNGHAADELDLSINYMFGKGLKLRTMYALFIPDSDVYSSKKTIHYFELELRYEFN